MLSRRKCHVSYLQRGAPAFPVWLMIKGKQQKGTEEDGKQLLAFEECEWGLSERKGTDSTPGCIPSVTISVCFPSCSKSQLRTGLSACSEDTHANSGCKGDLKLIFFIPHIILGNKLYSQSKQFNTHGKDSIHTHAIIMCTYALLQIQLTVNICPV